MSQLQRIAENLKLARQLGVAPEALDFLAPLADSELRALREDLAAAMFDEARPHFERVAAASRLVPNKLIAVVAEKFFGPMLCARVVGLIAPDTALDVALRTSDAFLAEAATQLDPRSARELIRRIPVDRVGRIAARLIARRDYVTMGRFVDYLAAETIGAVMNGIDDDEALLRTAFFIESKEVLNELVGLVPAERIKRLALLAGSGGHDLWAEALSLTTHMDAQWRGRIGDIVAEHGDELLTGMLRSAQRLGLWDAVLPVVGCMSVASRRRLARLPALAEAEVLRAIIVSADANDLWAAFLPLVDELSPAVLQTAAPIIGALDAAVLLRLIEAAGELELWPVLIRLLVEIPEQDQRRILELLGRQEAPVLARLLAEVDAHGLWPQLLPLAGRMDAAAQRQLGAALETLPSAALDHLLSAAAPQPQLWPDLLDIAVGVSASWQQALADRVGARSEELLPGILATLRDARLWQPLLALAARLPVVQQLQLLQTALGQGIPLLELVVEAPDDAALWTRVVAMFDRLDAPTRAALAGASRDPARHRAAIEQRARALGLSLSLEAG